MAQLLSQPHDSLIGAVDLVHLGNLPQFLPGLIQQAKALCKAFLALIRLCLFDGDNSLPGQRLQEQCIFLVKSPFSGASKTEDANHLAIVQQRNIQFRNSLVNKLQIDITPRGLLIDIFHQSRFLMLQNPADNAFLLHRYKRESHHGCCRWSIGSPIGPYSLPWIVKQKP